MRHVSIAVVCVLPVACAFCSAADLTDAQRAALRQALEPLHAQYDPAERMIKRPFSSPGYHTTLKGGDVHPTRESLRYAAALLDTGIDEHRERAAAIIDRVIALQDQNPQNRTYGIWSWFLEEPLEKMSPPDWNWADFCGKELLQVALFHRERLPAELMARVDESIGHAARSIQKRNVGPGYTNIAILGTYVTLVAAETYDIADLREYAMARLRRVHEHATRQGAFTEYNSPTYTLVTLKALALLRAHVKDDGARRLVDDLYRMAWEEVAHHFHPPTRQWAGPHSRAYRTLLDDSRLGFIQRATSGRVDFGLADAPIDLESYRVPVDCPRDLEPFFTKLDAPRTVTKTFVKDEPPVVGTTYLHPKFTLGTINRGDLWNQRRALVAYWGDAKSHAYLHVRFLHDGYDFAAAQFFSVQKEGTALAAINFATDGGDTHVSLDRIKNGTITAKDLRLRFEFGGAVEDLEIKMRADFPEREVRHGPVRIYPMVHFGEIDNVAGESRWEVNTQDGRKCLDLVLYHGEEIDVAFDQMATAGIGLSVQIRLDEEQPPRPDRLLVLNRLGLDLGQLSLSVPLRPDRASKLQEAVATTREAQ
jgi:hypothetical protein